MTEPATTSVIEIDPSTLDYYARRMRLARQEYERAESLTRRLTAALGDARDHENRCVEAARLAEHNLTEYAATGLLRRYCLDCDTFSTYQPLVGGAEPPCPACAQKGAQ